VNGCQGSNQEVLAPSFLKVISFAMMVSIGLGIVLAGRGFRRLGSWTINIGFKIGEGLLGSLARVLNSKILCASYCPTSSQIQLTSPHKHENRYV